MSVATTIRMAAHCMLAFASHLGAQETILTAPSIDAVWTGSDGRVRAQCGRRIVVTGDPVTSVAIPAGAIAFDHGPALAWCTSSATRVEGAGRAVKHDGAFTLRAEPGLLPLRAPLFLSDGVVLAPGTSTVHALDLATGTASDLGVAPKLTRDRGWGLTGEIVDDTTVPSVFGFEKDGKRAFVSGAAGTWFRIADGARAPLPPVEIKDRPAIEEFDHVVPPLFADFDGDGVPDLVRVDAAKGIVAVQGGLDRDPIPPPRIILLKTPILLTTAADAEGDGKTELIVVRLPALGPVQQLAILTQGKVTATVLVYSLAQARDAAATPKHSVDVSLGVDVVARNQVRKAEFRDLVSCGGAVLVATPGKPARRISYGDETTTLGAVPAGEWADPLRPVRAKDGVYAVLKAGGEARLVRFAE
jgi:hypothetical protein